MSSKEINIIAMKLPPQRRAKLAEQLLASLDDDAQREIESAWSAEAESRINEFDAGRQRSKPIAKVVNKLKRRNKR